MMSSKSLTNETATFYIAIRVKISKKLFNVVIKIQNITPSTVALYYGSSGRYIL